MLIAPPRREDTAAAPTDGSPAHGGMRPALGGSAGSRRRLLWAAAALGLCLLLFIGLRPSRQPARGGDLPTALALGQQAPEFALRDLQGRIVRLSTLRGRAVLLNFWATYCPPCRLEMPDLERAARHYRAAGARHASRTPLILHVANIPTTVVIDARGAIRQTHLGPLVYADILGALDAAR